MTYYAIRQMSTGYFMPQSKRRKGFTWDEPVKDCIPRLFKRACDARNALNHWLDGKSELTYTVSNWTGPGEYSLTTKGNRYHLRDDMEVVRVAVEIM